MATKYRNAINLKLMNYLTIDDETHPMSSSYENRDSYQHMSPSEFKRAMFDQFWDHFDEDHFDKVLFYKEEPTLLHENPKFNYILK